LHGANHLILPLDETKMVRIRQFQDFTTSHTFTTKPLSECAEGGCMLPGMANMLDDFIHANPMANLREQEWAAAIS
jgi:hypothetical protein